jgi:hypothetical protein
MTTGGQLDVLEETPELANVWAAKRMYLPVVLNPWWKGKMKKKPRVERRK